MLCVVCLCFVNVKGVLIQTGERETESRINRTATENEADREIEREN